MLKTTYCFGFIY